MVGLEGKNGATCEAAPSGCEEPRSSGVAVAYFLKRR